MFSSEILVKIFSKESTYDIPMQYQVTMIKVIEEVLEEEKNAMELHKDKLSTVTD